jgi:AAA15 family ATPase/GTPase
MLNLTFQRSHLSINNFPWIELPDFTLITGTNGAGKSHLLQAIHQGHVLTNVAPEQSIHNQTQIRIFDWSTMVPPDSGSFSSDTITNERQNLYVTISQLKNNGGLLEQPRNIIRGHGLSEEYIVDPFKFLSISNEMQNAIVDDESNLVRLKTDLINQANSIDAHIINQIDPTRNC